MGERDAGLLSLENEQIISIVAVQGEFTIALGLALRFVLGFDAFAGG